MQREHKSTPNIFIRSINLLSNIFGVISALGILAASLVVTQGVIVRYVFKSPTIWQVELTIYILMCATFLGTPWVLKENGHINIELVTTRFSPAVRDTLNLVTSAVALLFCVVIAWKGWLMWYDAYDGGWVSESLWSVPLKYPYLMIPLGMSLTSLQYMVKISAQAKQLRQKTS